jgi:dTDP-4-amino-4,6-dideoxygalactose transaminase
VHSQAVTEKSAASVLSLPMYPELTRDEIDAVCRETLAWCASSGARATSSR